MIEREVTLSTWSGFTLPDLDGVAPGARTRRRETIDLDISYYDTRDLRLSRRGIVLVHRRRGPRESWTLEPPPADGSDPDRDGEEVGAPGGTVPAPIELLVVPHVRTAALRRVVRLTTVRRRTVVEGPDGPLAEIDDDEVSVMDGGRVATRFRELEVGMTTDAGDAVADALLARLGVAGAELADLPARGMRALGPLDPPEVEVESLPDDPTAGQVVTAALRDSVRRVMDHHPIAVQGEDPEGVHKMRTASRRLRSDLLIFRPLLDRSVTDPLRPELKWLGQVLGWVRDPDVLGERLRTSAERALAPEDAESREVVLSRLEADRDLAVAELRETLASLRYRELLDHLVAVTEDPPLTADATRPAAEVLPALVRKPWKKLRASVKALPDDPSDDDLHEVRKAAKALRYAAEAVAPAVGKPARKAAKQARKVQDVLGEHQDAAEAEAWLRAAGARPDVEAREILVLGALVADERAQRRAHRDAWRDVWNKASDPDRWDWL